MAESKLRDLSMDFSVSVINICKEIKGSSALVNQLLRSGTSIGANIYEANYAQSKPDFISKLQIALKESNETEYWLKLFEKTELLSEEQSGSLLKQCGTLRRLLIASIKTAKTSRG
jgi:four helix bundle protein